VADDVPQIVQHPQTTYADEGDNVVMRCRAVGRMDPLYRWRKDGEFIITAVNERLQQLPEGQ